MPISDTYVVQCLLQVTEAARDSIVWREKEPGGYAAAIRGIALELHRVPGSTGSRLFLSLSCVPENVQIAEPMCTGFLGNRYASEDQGRLAGLMRELAAAVARQCAARSNRSAELNERIREEIYRRLIGATGAEG